MESFIVIYSYATTLERFMDLLRRYRRSIALVSNPSCRKCQVVEDMLLSCGLDINVLVVIYIDFMDMDNDLRGFLKAKGIRIPCLMSKDFRYLYVNPYHDNVCDLAKQLVQSTQ